MKRKTITIVILVVLLQIGTMVSANIAGGARILSGELNICNSPYSQAIVDVSPGQIKLSSDYEGYLIVNFYLDSFTRYVGTWRAKGYALDQTFFEYEKDFDITGESDLKNIFEIPSRYLKGKGEIYVEVSANYDIYKFDQGTGPGYGEWDFWKTVQTSDSKRVEPVRFISIRSNIFTLTFSRLLENHLFLFPMLRALFNRLPSGL